MNRYHHGYESSLVPGAPETPSVDPQPPAFIRHAVSQRFIKQYQWLMGIFFGIHFLYLLYLQTRSDVADNRGLRVASDAMVFTGSLVCAVVCLYMTGKFLALRRNTTEMIVRRAWIAVALLGCSAAVYAIGQAIWTGYEAAYPTSQFPYPAAYDFFYLAVYPFGWAAIALLVPHWSTAAGRVRILLDAATAVLSFLAISWYFILGPTLAVLSGSGLEKFVSLAYPLGDLSLCAASAILLFGTSGVSALNAAIGRLALGVTVLAATDSLYGYFQLQGVYHTGFLQDIGWPMSWLLIGWAMLTYLSTLASPSVQQQSRGANALRLRRTGAVARAISPMILALLTCGLLLFVVALRQGAPLIQVMLVCSGLFLLPILRQALTLIDNLILNERLRVALEQSHRAFQQSQQELLLTMPQAELYESLQMNIQDLQQVHASLARGDMAARAQVAGPLSTVAQSLNLLIERMNRWAQVLQHNTIMEQESRLLAQHLEYLSEGQIVLQKTLRASSLSTGAALFGVARLQQHLHVRFRRINETVLLLSQRTRSLGEMVSRMCQEMEDRAPSSYPVGQMLSQVERGLANIESTLQELQQQTEVYLDPAGSRTTMDARNPGVPWKTR